MRILCGLFAATIYLVLITDASAQAITGEFELVDALGNVTGLVEQRSDQLRFRLRSGERRQYNRESRYDSADGRLLGYTNFELNRVLRIPRSGVGVCWVADLDNRYPQYRQLPQTLRPIHPNVASPPGIGIPYGAYAGPQSGYNYRLGPMLTPAPYASGYRYRPTSVLLESRVIANPLLAPVRIQLLNPTNRELQVALVDLIQSSRSKSIHIAPGQVTEVEVARDGGGKRISRYQTFDLLGYPIEKEIVAELPPVVRYEIVVHEWAMQSVAIDRTGKSANVIEDIQYQGRGIGRFTLPPGDALQPGTIDVYRAAVNAGNQGAVTPLVPNSDQPSHPADKLQQAILEAQQRAMSGRRP